MSEQLPTLAPPRNLDPSLLSNIPQEQSKVLGSNEVATILPPEVTSNVESYQFGNGSMIQGTKIAAVEIGGERAHAEIAILDIRQAPIVGQATRISEKGTQVKYITRQIGTKDGEPIIMAGDFAMIIPSESDSKPEIRALVPGQMWNVGRDEGFTGLRNANMPDTVSRDHCAVGMNDNGSIVVENHEPTNITKLVTLPSETVEFSGGQSKEAIELEQAIELLSYTDVLAQEAKDMAIEYTKTAANGLKYTHELQGIIQEHGLAQVMQVAERMRQECLENMKKLGITPSQFAESQSWALWDIAKQHYSFTHPEERDENYNGKNYMYVANPLAEGESGDLKRKEIIDRHLGWEADLAINEGRFQPHGVVIDEVQAVRENGQRNQTGQLRSFELARLGRKLRRTISKDKS